MKTINIYNFNELNDSAKETAINNYRDKYYEYHLESFNEYAMERISEAGFNGNIKLQYSLSNCQGDGLSFSCDYYSKLIDIFVDVLGENKPVTIETIINNCDFTLKGNTGRYCYSMLGDVEYNLSFYANVQKPQRINEIINDVQYRISQIYVELCNELEKEGYTEIEYQNSDEYIIEFFENNIYDFLENGQRL